MASLAPWNHVAPISTKKGKDQVGVVIRRVDTPLIITRVDEIQCETDLADEVCVPVDGLPVETVLIALHRWNRCGAAGLRNYHYAAGVVITVLSLPLDAAVRRQIVSLLVHKEFAVDLVNVDQEYLDPIGARVELIHEDEQSTARAEFLHTSTRLDDMYDYVGTIGARMAAVGCGRVLVAGGVRLHSQRIYEVGLLLTNAITLHKTGRTGTLVPSEAPDDTDHLPPRIAVPLSMEETRRRMTRFGGMEAGAKLRTKILELERKLNTLETGRIESKRPMVIGSSELDQEKVIRYNAAIDKDVENEKRRVEEQLEDLAEQRGALMKAARVEEMRARRTAEEERRVAELPAFLERRLPPEPAEGAPDSVSVAFKVLSNGTQFRRRFHTADPAKAMWQFAKVHTGLEVPFELFKPPRGLIDAMSNKSIGEAFPGERRFMVFVNDNTDDYDPLTAEVPEAVPIEEFEFTEAEPDSSSSDESMFGEGKSNSSSGDESMFGELVYESD